MNARPALALGLLIALAGCQSSAPQNRDSPYYAYPAGLSLSLLKPVEIAAGSATARLQFGNLVARNGVEETEPYCIFEINTVRERPQQVAPERFKITGVQRRVSTFAGLPAAALLRTVGQDRDDGASHLYFITEFSLRAEQQPHVRSLSCQSNQLAPGITIMRHLTLAEIRQALGGYFTLDLPG